MTEKLADFNINEHEMTNHIKQDQGSNYNTLINIFADPLLRRVGSL